MSKYKEVNGTSYNSETPIELVNVLESCRTKRTRIVVDYGNTNTGESWNEVFGTMGYVGRSTGNIKIPLLVYNSKSLGGSAILDSCILSVKESRGKKILYQLKTLTKNA